MEPRKKDALLSQLSVVVQDSFERDRVALREELEPIKERLRPLDLLNVNSSAIMEDTDWVADGHDPIMARTPQETAMAIGGFYLNSPSFLQGLIVGSAASILGFLLLSR